jgi:type I restriction enzyme S subunit
VIREDAPLPEGWVFSTLAAVVAPSKEKVDPASTPDVPYVGLEHVEAHTMRLLGHGRGSDVRSTKTKFSAGDVLYGKLRPYLNKVARPDFDGICSTDFLVFKESPVLDSGYLASFLNQLWVAGEAHHLSNGIELPRVDWKSLSKLPIAHPKSKVEQRLIVEQIDAVRRVQSSAAMHLDVAGRTIDRFRQAVLAAACSGRLTADWREMHGHTPGIDSLLEDVDTRRKRPYRVPAPDWRFEIPEGWALVSLDRLTTLITSGSRGWAKYYAVDGPLFIRSQDIHSDRLELDDIAHVRPPGGSEGVRTRAQKGDILVTITGANVTRSARVDRDLEEAYVNQHVALARPAILGLAEYLHLWVVSQRHGRLKLASDAYGAGRPGLNLENLKTLPVGLPPIEEQAEIATRVQQLLTLAQHVDQRIEVAASRVERTSKAVLAKAFRGDLSVNGGVG